jgi:hypothetical protein
VTFCGQYKHARNFFLIIVVNSASESSSMRHEFVFFEVVRRSRDSLDVDLMNH